jgi:glycine cleavage system H lipoate-binding protein
MNCPFLKETEVKYCGTSAVRKLIPLAQSGRAEDKCSSGDHTSCQIWRRQPEASSEAIGESAGGPCPYLRESLMQFCGAAPVPKMIPYSESLLSRCGNDSYLYCDLYRAMAHPGQTNAQMDSIEVPGWLRYSNNHMWLDVSKDGICHVGIDAFLSRALGTVERISYVWQQGVHRPTAVLTAAGMDLEVVFPNPFLITGCNLYLRANPDRLTTEPYTRGWLFEGRPQIGTDYELMNGAAARVWMEQEQSKINQYLQHQTGCAADGGMFAPGLASRLEREQMLGLFYEFFSRK